MDSQAYNTLYNRLQTYIDTLDLEQTDQQLVVNTVLESLLTTAPQPEQIDFPSISPKQEQTTSGHELMSFRGELKVPTITREHDVQVSTVSTDTSFNLPMLSLPFLFPRIRPWQIRPIRPPITQPVFDPVLRPVYEPVQELKPDPYQIPLPPLTEKTLEELRKLRDKLKERLKIYRKDPWLGPTIVTIAAKYGKFAKPQVFARFANLLKSGTLMRAFQASMQALSRSRSLPDRAKLLAIPAAFFVGAGAVFADEPTEQQIQLLAKYSQTLLEKENVEREIMLRQLEASGGVSDDTQTLSEDVWKQMKAIYFELVPVEITPGVEELFPDPRLLGGDPIFREDVFPDEVVYRVEPTSQLLQLMQSAEQGDLSAGRTIELIQKKIKSISPDYTTPVNKTGVYQAPAIDMFDMDQAIRAGYIQQYTSPDRSTRYHLPAKNDAWGNRIERSNQFIEYDPMTEAIKQRTYSEDFQDYQGTRLIENQSPPDLNAPTFEFDIIPDTSLPELKSSTDIPNIAEQPDHDDHVDTRIHGMIDTHLNQTEQLMHERGHIIKQIKQLTNE